MAKHGKKWPTLGIIGMRNEFRQPKPASRALPYNWFVWQQYMTQAAAEIHQVNPIPLLSMMGLPWVTTLIDGLALSGPNVTSGTSYTAYFRREQYAWSDKVILENHRYDSNPTKSANCTRFIDEYLALGFKSLDLKDNSVVDRWPVILGEWGFSQDGVYYLNEYPQCLVDFFRQYKPNWMYWTLAGSYYIYTKNGQSSVLDFDDGYGLLNHNWTSWRSPETIQKYFRPAIKASK